MFCNHLNGKYQMKILARIWWGWVLVYFATGCIANMQGGTGIFARPIDEFESVPFILVFLNFPLQMLLAITAYSLWEKKNAKLKMLGTWLGIAASVLIGVNFFIGCWLALS